MNPAIILFGSIALNVVLGMILVLVLLASKPLLIHAIAKLKKERILLTFTESNEWEFVRTKIKQGFAETKEYGDFIATPEAFKPLDGVPLAIVHSKIGVTLPIEFIKDANLLKRTGTKLEDFVKFSQEESALGYNVEEINNVFVPGDRVDEETKAILELSGAEKYEHEENGRKISGFLLDIKDTFEYILYNINPINIRARINARVEEEIASRRKRDVLTTVLAIAILVIIVTFAIVVLNMYAPGSGEAVSSAVQGVKESLPISIP